MRWVFLTLLLLNVLVFAAQWMNPAGAGNHRQAPAVSMAGDSIVLLSEASNRGVIQEVLKNKPAEAEVGTARSCLVLGPTNNEQQALGLLGRLQEQSISARVLQQEISRAPDYWVYLPPLPDRDAAVRVLRELHQVHKIDSFLISQGPLVNGISLGLFKNREAALALQRERVAQGLDAQLVEVERTGIGFWVVIEAPTEAYAAQKIDQLLVSEDFPGERRQIYCKGIASLEKLP